MRLMPVLGAAAALVAAAPALAQAKGTATASSPGGVVSVEVSTDGDGRALYAVSRNGKPVIAPSRLGFLFTDVAKIDRRLEITGTETREAVNADPALLARLEAVRVAGALRMGLISDAAQGAQRAHSPKLVMVAPPAGFTASDGRAVRAEDIDLLTRAVSMGRLHHAMMGTASVAIAAAAAVPGTLVHEAAGGRPRDPLRFGHPAGTLSVGAQAECVDGRWRVTRATMTRSARVLMDGHVHLPPDFL